MTEWKSTNPTSSSSQSSIDAMKIFLADGRLTTLSSPPYSPHLAGRGEWGWSEGAPGQCQSGQHYYRGRNAEQTPPPFPSMSNSSSLYTLFYSVIYNSVSSPITCAKNCTRNLKQRFHIFKEGRLRLIDN